MEHGQGGDSGDDQMLGADYDIDVDGLPIWRRNRRLSDYPERYRSAMYRKKVAQSRQGRHKLFLCERAIHTDDFEKFGLTRSFERLGWEENMVFNNDDNEEVYMDEILEWMSTLKRAPGNNPPLTMRLIGEVNEKQVVLSFDTIQTLGRFDSGTENGDPYVYPSDAVLSVSRADEENWKEMIRELFEVPPGQDIAQMILHRDKLKIFPRLLIPFVTSNLIPRVSDKEMVRLSDVLVLHALARGQPTLSARHMIMYNVWEARERQPRKAIPHARLLTKLLKKQGAVPRTVRGVKVKHIPWKMSVFVRSSVWNYQVTSTMHRLICSSTGKSIDVRRDDVEPEAVSEEEESEGGNLPPRVLSPIALGFTLGQYTSPYYTHLQDHMSQSRPSSFGDWNEGMRMMYDRQSQELEEARIYRWTMATQQELYRNQDFNYNEAIRHERDYERGWDYTVRPRPTNWADPHMEPYEVTQQLPRSPQSTPSMWILPFTQQQPDQSSSSSSTSGPYHMGNLEKSLMESIFGAIYQPPPYDG